VEYLIHVANVLYVFSYSVRDILWLRLLTVAAMVSLIPFYYVKDLKTAIYWNILFLAINLYQLYRLLLERRPVQLTLEQQRLYRGPFRAMTPREFVKFVDLGGFEDLAVDDALVEQGAKLDRLTLIADGIAVVKIDEHPVSQLQAGQFVGEMGYLTGQPACASVLAGTTCRCLRWDNEKLRTFLADNPSVRSALQDIIGTDLAEKLRGPAPSPA
jgi:CRP-like cAMP-binding protein